MGTLEETMFSTPNSKLLSSMEELGVSIQQIRHFKRNIALHKRGGDTQGKLNLRFTSVPAGFSIVCFTIDDVGVLLIEVLPPCSQWEELTNILKEKAKDIRLDLCSIYIVCSNVPTEAKARDIRNALHAAYQVDTLVMADILNALTSLRSVFPSIRDVYPSMHTSVDSGKSEQGIMVELKGSDVVLFPIIAGHVIHIRDVLQPSLLNATALSHLNDAAQDRVILGVTPAILQQWMVHAPTQIDALVAKHSNITMVTMGPRMKGGQVTTELAVIVGVLKKGVRRLGEPELDRVFVLGQISYPVDVQEIFPFVHSTTRQKLSENVQPGLSIGPKLADWCGTLGGILSVNGEKYICSNEHVLPKGADATVYQPSDLDVSRACSKSMEKGKPDKMKDSHRSIARRTHGMIGNIALTETISVGVDVAIAKIHSNRTITSSICAYIHEKTAAKLPLLDKLTEPLPRLLDPLEVLRAVPNRYFKLGRSSGLTSGIIPDSSQVASFVVNKSWADGSENLYDIHFENKDKYVLHNQFVLLGSFGTGLVMSDSGDSGSFVFDGSGQVIGLLHGGLSCNGICAIVTPLAAVYAAIRQMTGAASVSVFA